jgi:hypothetical protein
VIEIDACPAIADATFGSTPDMIHVEMQVWRASWSVSGASLAPAQSFRACVHAFEAERDFGRVAEHEAVGADERGQVDEQVDHGRLDRDDAAPVLRLRVGDGGFLVHRRFDADAARWEVDAFQARQR